MTLDTEDQLEYQQVIKAINRLLGEHPDNGFAFIMNALALAGPENLMMMQVWIEQLSGGPDQTLDGRDVAGIIHERPLGYPEFSF